MTSDAGLISLCRNGDEDALRELYRRHCRRVDRFCYEIIGNSHDADEAVQDVFLRIYRGAAHYDPTRKPLPWIYAIAANVCRDYLKRRRSPLPLYREFDRADDSNRTPDDRRESVERAIDRLAPNQKEAILLRYYEEFSYAEIAEITRSTIGGVESLLYRARKAILGMIGEKEQR